MSEFPAMTAAEMRCTREILGLSVGWMSRHLVIDDRRLRRMEAGTEQITPALITFLDDLYEYTKTLVEDMSAVYRRQVKSSGGGIVALKTYRTDADYHQTGGMYPARWHRQMCARVALAVPGLVLVL